MGIRLWLDQHPKAAAIAISVTVVTSTLASAYLVRPEKARIVTKAFYTTDDGKTWFADSDHLIPPFDRDGKEALRVHLFTCDDGKTQFAGYLERFTPEVKKKLELARAEAAKSGSQPTLNVNSQEVVMRGIEVKRPDENKWVMPNDLIGKSKITRLSCPSGEPADSVYP